MTPATIQKINVTAVATTIFCGLAVAWLITMEDVRITSGMSKREYPALRTEVTDLSRRMATIETQLKLELRHVNHKLDQLIQHMEANR